MTLSSVLFIHSSDIYLLLFFLDIPGGPDDHSQINTLYRNLACLSDGEYTFTIFNDGDHSNSLDNVGAYFVGANVDEIIVNPTPLSSFGGSFQSTKFRVGPNPPSLPPSVEDKIDNENIFT